MRQAVVVANWKMNGTRQSVRQLLIDLVAASDRWHAEVIVCPPFVFLSEAQSMLQETDIRLGAQNANANPSGAYTGEIAAQMLKEFGCGYVIVGHSERRSHYGESDVQIAAKFAACQAVGLTPILCVGETGEERRQDLTVDVVSRQVASVIDQVGIAAFGDALLAYEPVWAIGTGVSASADQAEAVHRLIRNLVAESDRGIAAGLRILYGGSVTAANAAELFAQEDIDGALVGGASLKAAEFAEICSSAG